MTTEQGAEPISDQPENQITLPFSEYQSVWHFCILSVLSLGVYPFFWFFKHWQYLRDEKGFDISPSFRTVFSLFYGYSLFHEYKELAIEKGYKKNPPLLLIFIVYIAFTVLVNIKGSTLTLSVLFSFVFLIPVHRMMNFYYLKEQAGYPIRKKLSKGEKTFLISIWVFLILMAFVQASTL